MPKGESSSLGNGLGKGGFLKQVMHVDGWEQV